jgi:hypothetical protein
LPTLRRARVHGAVPDVPALLGEAERVEEAVKVCDRCKSECEQLTELAEHLCAEGIKELCPKCYEESKTVFNRLSRAADLRAIGEFKDWLVPLKPGENAYFSRYLSKLQ